MVVIIMLVYKITNLVNGKIYVGQTTRTLPQRWAEHKRGKDRCSVLNAAIKKHGFQNFGREVLQVCSSQDELNKQEVFWISELSANKRGVGYNMSLGGKHAPLTENARLKLSLAKKGVKKSPETIARMRVAAKKRGVSPITRQRFKEVCCVPIRCVSTGCEFPSIIAASRETGCHPISIRMVSMNKKSSTKGLVFEFIKKE